MRIVVLISGNGSNLQAIIDAKLPVAAVISNEPEAFGITRAKQANIPIHIVNHNDFHRRIEFDTALQECIDQYNPGLIVLAGFMRILGSNFVNHYLGKIINIHPSLLPKYKGCNTHSRALENGEKQHGTSVHFVTPELDDGPIIAQSKLTITQDETPSTLKEKIQILEHKLYPYVIRQILQKHIYWHDGKAIAQSKTIPSNGIMLNL